MLTQQRVLKLRAAGWTLQEIGDAHGGLSRQWVHQIEHGNAPRGQSLRRSPRRLPRRKKTDQKLEKINARKLRQSGASILSIANKASVSWYTANEYVYRNYL